MIKKISILLVAVLILSSCKTTKKTGTKTDKTDMLLKEVVNNYHRNLFDKKTIKASIKGKYKGKQNLPSVNVSLRMKKDKVIWMSISKFIPIGKLLITPERVQFYNKLTKEYFDGDFSLLSNFLGTEVSFEQIQNILVGQAINDLNTKDYVIETKDDMYLFVPKNQKELFDIFFLLNTSNFKVAKQEINKDNKQLEVMYPEYQKIESVYFPKEIFLKTQDGNEINTVDILYKSVKFNEKLTFPFSIPDGYKEIKL